MGASGDMILGALLDLGADPVAVENALRHMGLDGFSLAFSRIEGQHHIRYGRCEVRAAEHHHHRRLADILNLIDKGELAARVQDRATRIFRRLAAAEAAVHGIPPEAVHFHEVGAIDAIVDIVGSCIALELLEVGEVYCSALTAGTGTIECAHGILPNPAPATVELMKGFPVRRLPVDAELTTPTGAAILTTLAAGDWTGQARTWVRVGTGHGSRELAAGPNVIRAYLLAPLPGAPGTEDAMVIETDIDDDAAEITATLPQQLREAGALDAMLTPLLMKKGRPGVRLTVLAHVADTARMADLILRHSSSIGVRSYPVRRFVLPRAAATVSTPWGDVQAKRIVRPDGTTELAPEFESCRELAIRTGVPLRQIMTAARRFEPGVTPA